MVLDHSLVLASILVRLEVWGDLLEGGGWGEKGIYSRAASCHTLHQRLYSHDLSLFLI